MFINCKRNGTPLNFSNLKDEREYLERLENENSKKVDSMKLLKDKLKGITKKVSFHKCKTPTMDFLTKLVNQQKMHEKKNSFVYNNIKEENDMDKSFIEIIKFKNQRSSHSGPKYQRQETHSKEKSKDTSNVKNLSFVKNKLKDIEVESPKMKDLKIKYYSTKNEKTKKLSYADNQEENVKNNLFKKVNEMKKIYQMDEKREFNNTANFTNKFTSTPKDTNKMKDLFKNNLKIHDEEEIMKTINLKHPALEIRTSKEQKVFEFPKYLQNYTCTSKDRKAPSKNIEQKDKLSEYKEFLKAKMKQINEKMECKLKEADDNNYVNNTLPSLETENSYKLFTNLKYQGNPSPNNIKLRQEKPEKVLDKTMKFKEDYIVGKEIGQGAYATVRIAIHKTSKTRVAIKIYEKIKIMDPQRKKSVKREIKLLKMMSHPYIIKLHETYETNHHINIIMEYVGGPSLYTYLKSQPNKKLDEIEAKRIFIQITEALQYCHHKCITHRDIKLENLLMDENKNIKLIDFGFSTYMPIEQKAKMFCGTPSYMSPEIVLKKEYCGPPADIWALGVLLFALLCGFFPYKGSTDHELYTKISTADYIIPENISKAAKNLLEMIFVIDSMQRPTAEEILNHEWLRKSDNMDSNYYDNKEIINVKNYLNINNNQYFANKPTRNINEKPIKSKERQETEKNEEIFYRPNTFYVNTKNLYINVNETPNREDSSGKPKQKTCLQNKHSLIINNLNNNLNNDKKLNISLNTTKHKRNCTENLQIDPDFVYINKTHEYPKEYCEDLPSGQKKYNQTIFPSNVPSMMTMVNSTTSRSPSSISNKNTNKININQAMADKTIKNLDRSKIVLNQNQNDNNSSFINMNTNTENLKNKFIRNNDNNIQNHKNIYENNGYINYLKDKEEFNSILHLK